MIRTLIILLISIHFQALSQEEVKTSFKSLEEALKQPQNVIELTLKRDRLRVWPDSQLRQFPNLKRLDLSSNKIDSLPPDLSYLSKLEYLDLTSNKLDSLQYSIGDLSSLKELKLGNNEIYHVTPRIGELTELEIIELWSNNIYYLPYEAGELKKLRDLDLRNIQMNQEHQNAIEEIFESERLKIRFSMSCNCN